MISAGDVAHSYLAVKLWYDADVTSISKGTVAARMTRGDAVYFNKATKLFTDSKHAVLYFAAAMARVGPKWIGDLVTEYDDLVVYYRKLTKFQSALAYHLESDVRRICDGDMSPITIISLAESKHISMESVSLIHKMRNNLHSNQKIEEIAFINYIKYARFITLQDVNEREKVREILSHIKVS